MAQVKKAAEENELVVRARIQSEALGRLYEIYYEPIFRFCMHRLFFREAAEDVTSEIFLAVAEKIKSFRGITQTDFRNWIYAIAVNHTNSYLRTTIRRKKLFEKAASSMYRDVETGEKDDWTFVYSAILKLKPKTQTIIVLRYFENLEFDEISKIVKARKATVHVMLHRGLKKLERYLQSYLKEDK